MYFKSLEILIILLLLPKGYDFPYLSSHDLPSQQVASCPISLVTASYQNGVNRFSETSWPEDSRILLSAEIIGAPYAGSMGTGYSNSGPHDFPVISLISKSAV